MIDEKQLKENLLSNMSELNKRVNKLRDNLNVGVLNVNTQIKEIIKLMTSIGKMKKDVVFTSEENTKFENEFNTLKLDFKRLKSKHIEKYNERVMMINRRFKPLSQKLLDRNLSDDIKSEIKLVPHLIKTDVLNDNRDWRHHTYLDKLDYDKMEFAELMIVQVENKLNVKNTDITDEMKAIVDEASEVLNAMEQKVNVELNAEDIDKCLFECGTLLGRLLSLTSEHEKLRYKISKEKFSHFSSKIVNLQNRLNSIREKLLSKKNVLGENSVYNNFKNQLDALYNQYTELEEIISENKNKCTETMIVDYRKFLSKFKEKLDKIVVSINLDLKNGKINQQQYNNLIGYAIDISNVHNDLKEKLNNEPVLKSKNSFGDNFFKGIETDLRKLKKEIDALGDGVIKDRKIRKKYDIMINELGNSLESFKSMLLHYDETNSTSYKELKNKYDGYKKEFDEINNSYNAKCPLVIRKVREAKPVYKKHKKLSLISAGLASVALVNSSYAIIPAIMHGNSMLGTVPGFKGMMNFFNKILGGLIGASVGKNGVWVLATGAVLNGTVATTSILKFLATIGVGAAAFTAPLYIPQIILLIKQLIEKIKAYDLKQKFVNTYQSGTKKVKKVVKKVEQKMDEVALNGYYKELYSIYVDYCNGMSLDEFCKKRNLSEGDKKVLSLMISKGKLEDELQKIVGEQVTSGKRKAKTA